MKINLSILFLLLMLPFSLLQGKCAFAAKKSLSQREFLTQYRTELDEINAYLYKLKTLQVDFSQIDSNSLDKSTGVIYLDRTSKSFTMDYLKGDTKAKIISVGGKNYLIDKELEEVTQIKNSNTAAKALFLQSVTSRELAFRDIKTGPLETILTFVLSARQDEGVITISFGRDPYYIKYIQIKNPTTYESAKVVFLTQQQNIELDPSEFKPTINKRLK